MAYVSTGFGALVTSCAALVFAVLVAMPGETRAQTCEDAGLHALREARDARRTLANLETMEAHLWRERALSKTMARAMATDERVGQQYEFLSDETGALGVHAVAGAVRSSDDFRGYDSCLGNSAAVLERSWWGVYEGVHPSRSNPWMSFGVNLFHLRATDGLRYDTRDADLGEIEVEHGQSITGLEYVFEDRVSVMLALASRTSPIGDLVAMTPAELADVEYTTRRRVFASVGVPALGLVLDVGSASDLRGLDIAQLGMQDLALPWGMTGSLLVGHVRHDAPLMAAAAVGSIPGGFRVDAAAEGFPVRLRFARLRWERPLIWDRVYSSPPDPHWPDAPPTYAHSRWDVRPFAELSMNYVPTHGSASEQGWAPGFQTGVAVRWMIVNLTLGMQLHAGINTPDALVPVTETAGHFSWGTRMFAQIGI